MDVPDYLDRQMLIRINRMSPLEDAVESGGYKSSPDFLYHAHMARPARQLPRELVDGWPDGPSDDAVAEVTRLFAVNLRAAIGDRSLRVAAAPTGVDHTTILKILDGRTWPDAATIAKLEIGLETRLWPIYPR